MDKCNAYGKLSDAKIGKNACMEGEMGQKSAFSLKAPCRILPYTDPILKRCIDAIRLLITW